MNIELLYPALYGLLIGGAFSIVLGVYSKPTASKYSYAIFGTSSSHLMKYVTVLLAAFSIAIFAGFSALIRDTTFPTENPYLFTLETILASTVPAAIIFCMTYFRGKDFTQNTYIDFTLLSLKFALVHILLQFSGVYGSVFS